MKKCENCQLFRQLRYKGGETWYNYCYRDGYLNPCSGGKCDFPKYFKPIRGGQEMNNIKNRLEGACQECAAPELEEPTYIPTADECMYIYNFINRYKNGDFGIKPLQEIIDKHYKYKKQHIK